MVTFVFFTFLLNFKLLISSLKVFNCNCSLIFKIVLMFVVLLLYLILYYCYDFRYILYILRIFKNILSIVVSSFPCIYFVHSIQFKASTIFFHGIRALTFLITFLSSPLLWPVKKNQNLLLLFFILLSQFIISPILLKLL